MNDMYWIRRALAAVGLMTTLFLAGAVGLRADEDCQKRINKADHNLHEAIEHHGRDSEQAQHWRGELQQARNRCWDHGHRWGTPMPIAGAPTMTGMTMTTNTIMTTTNFVT